MKTHTLIACTAAVLLLSGCIPSVNPFYTEKDIAFDERLLGEWDAKDTADEPKFWKFEPGGKTNTYRLTVTEKGGKHGRFDVCLFKLKGDYFLDLIPAECELADDQADLVAFSMFRGHLLMRVTLPDPDLKIAAFDFDWLAEFLEANPKALAHHTEEKSFVLTASTRDLQPFVLKHLGEGELFQKPVALVRKTGKATASATTESGKPLPRRLTYTPRPYPVDEYGFTPVDKALAKAYAREELVTDDAEGSLNPYIMKVISAYPLDGSYPYHACNDPQEYDIYNGVTQDQWFKGMVVAKAYPDGSRASYCCGFTFEVFIRAMKLRNIHKGLDPDDFNGMSFNDLFNLLQIWYIEGKGDSEQRGIVAYGLGRAITNFDDVRPGDILSYSSAPSGGHSCIFIEWLRDDPSSVARQPSEAPSSSGAPNHGGADVEGALRRVEQNQIIGLKYFSSNLGGSKGVGYSSGKFSDVNNGRGPIRKSLRIARVGAIKDYKPFNRADIPQRNAYAPTQPNRIIHVPASPK